MARWHHASCDVAVGIHATVGGIGAEATIAPNSLPRRSGAESAPNAKRRSKVVPQPLDDSKALTAAAPTTGGQELPEHGRPMRLGWAKLLKRVFNLDLTHCPHCGGDLRMIAAILQRQAIEKILNHLGLDPQPPPRAPAHGQMALQKRQV